MRIIFVCEGNSCRSVIAEYLFRKMLEQSNIQGIQASSRGLDVRYPSPGVYTDKVMREEYGLDVSRHVPRELNKEEGCAADLILTMSRNQKERALYYGWAQPDKVFTLGEYVGEDGAKDIQDPYGGTREQYLEIAKRIERYLSRVIDKIRSKDP